MVDIIGVTHGASIKSIEPSSMGLVLLERKIEYYPSEELLDQLATYPPGTVVGIEDFSQQTMTELFKIRLLDNLNI